MIFSLKKSELLSYTSSQLNNFYPDARIVHLNQISHVADVALDRLHFCFKHVAFDRYTKHGDTFFNHLYADHYLMYIWFLSNTIWKETEDENLSAKLYYLNKTLHGFDCMFNTNLPDIFLIFHGVGTMLGKACYNDFLVVLQGCTVGSQKGFYPKIGKGVALTANSSVVGSCNIGDRSTISIRTSIFNSDVPNDSVAFIDQNTGGLKIKNSKTVYSQQFFNVKLNDL